MKQAGVAKPNERGYSRVAMGRLGTHTYCGILIFSQERAESSRTQNSLVGLIFGVQYMLGARWRTKTECFKIHYRAKVQLQE